MDYILIIFPRICITETSYRTFPCIFFQLTSHMESNFAASMESILYFAIGCILIYSGRHKTITVAC